MSFTKVVKEELCQIKSNNKNQLAELAALIQLGAELVISDQKLTLWFKSIHPIVARRFLSLVKNLYDIEKSILIQSDTQFKTKKLIEIGIDENVRKIMSEHNLFTQDISQLELLVLSDDGKSAYLRGAFLRGGSINHPRTANYHLEIYSDNSTQVIFIQQLLVHFGLNAKITKRRKGFITYIKEVEHIIDFLRIVGTSDAVFLYEDFRIKRDFNNSVNRVINIEIANEKRAITAAFKQLEDIKVVENSFYYKNLDSKLIRVMNLRKENPEASLNELVEEYENKFMEPITKSGLNHRFIKIRDLAKKITGEA